jgi:DNA-binding NarL/FixJ family response regulator
MQPTLAEPVSVLIVDDQRLVRTGFRVILASEPGIDVVGEAANGVEAVDLARSRQPDVVLMDIRMPLLDGFEATRKVLAVSRSRVLILTTFDSDEYVYEALRAGASASCSRTRRPISSLRPSGAWRPATRSSTRPSPGG